MGQQRRRGTDVEAVYELTGPEEGLLFHARFGILPGTTMVNGAFVNQNILTIEGELDENIFQKSLDYLVGRHEMLRASFVLEQSERPAKVIAPFARLGCRTVDLRSWPETIQKARIQALLSDERERGVDLSRPPLLRGLLLRTADTCYQFVLTHYTYVIDAWSTDVLRRELIQVYSTLVKGGAPDLAEVPRYSTYLDWLTRKQENLEAQAAFWKEELKGIENTTYVSAFQRIQAAQDALGHSISTDTTAFVNDDLTAFLRSSRLTLYSLFQTAVGLVLSRYQGGGDVVFGIDATSRPPEIESSQQMIGQFSAAIPMRLRVREDATVLDWLQATQEQSVSLLSRAFLGLAQIHRFIGRRGGDPLFRVLLGTRRFSSDGEGVKGDPPPVRFGQWRNYHGGFWALLLRVYPANKPVMIDACEYDPSVIDDGSVDQVINQVARVMEQFARRPQARVRDISVLSEEESRRVTVDLNANPGRIDFEKSLHSLLEDSTRRRSGAIAVIHGSDQLTYAELNERADCLAALLHARRMGEEALVGICVPRCLDMVVAVLGILKAGGAYVPLVPDLPPARLVQMAANAKLVITTRAFESKFEGAPVELICLDDMTQQLRSYRGAKSEAVVQPTNRAYVIHTSGSTGRPKGVVIEHRSAVNTVLDINERFGVGSSDTVFALSSLGFDLSVYDLFGTFAAGGTMVLSDAARIDCAHWISTLRSTGATVWNSVPALLELLVEYAERNKEAFPATLRLILLSGDYIPVTLADRIRRLCPNARIIALGGATEAAIWSNYYEIDKIDRRSRSVPYGRPLTHQTMYVLDRDLRPLPVGAGGELHIGGVGVAREYLGDPELTAKRFVKDPFSTEPHARLYKTGDLCRVLADGNIEIAGRIDNQVKIRGHRVELEEIEAVLATVPGIRRAVVVVNKAGTNELVAYIVPDESSPPSERDIGSFLSSRLPDHMVPRRYVFVPNLQLNSNGKVDRGALKGIPLPAGSQGQPPATQTESKLASIWSRLLGRGEIFRGDDFFDLGGNSLSVTYMSFHVKATFGVDLAMPEYFQATKLEALAARIDQQQPAPALLARNSRDPDVDAAERDGPGARVVKLSQRGDAAKSFFCVHPSGGGIGSYVQLARLLEGQWRFYGVQFPEAKPSGAHSMGSLATEYVTAIRKVQPHGPYLLGGWSMGGAVAFEMAQQLVASGEQVPFLGLIDATAEATRSSGNPRTPAELLTSFGRGMLASSGLAMEESDPAFDDLVPVETRLSRLFQLLRNRGVLAAETDQGHLARRFDIYVENLQTLEAYRPQSYAGPAWYFEVSARPHSLAWAPFWQSVVSGRFYAERVPGDHYSIFRQPYVRSLAATLRYALRFSGE